LPFGNHVRSSSLDGARGPTFNPTLRRNFVRSARSGPKRLRDAARLSTLAHRLGEAVNDRPEEIGEHGAFSRDDQHVGQHAGHELSCDFARRKFNRPVNFCAPE
jgi:hypothetical protein